MCEAQGRVTASEHVDHIKPVSGPGDPLFWEPTNHQALCQSCHSIKTAREDGAFGNKRRENTDNRG
jgi:5-methylcytosine-specific restriction protein A